MGCVGALLARPPLASPPVPPALRPLPTRTIPFTPSQIPTVPPFLNNTKLQEGLWRIVNTPWFPPSRPLQPPPRQQYGRRLYTNKREDLSDRRAAVLDVMVPLSDLDDPLREEVRDLLHGVVRGALVETARDPTRGLPPAKEMVIKINEAKTRIPLQPLHTWCVDLWDMPFICTLTPRGSSS
jgi:hypothetical protein